MSCVLAVSRVGCPYNTYTHIPGVPGVYVCTYLVHDGIIWGVWPYAHHCQGSWAAQAVFALLSGGRHAFTELGAKVLSKTSSRGRVSTPTPEKTSRQRTVLTLPWSPSRHGRVRVLYFAPGVRMQESGTPGRERGGEARVRIEKRQASTIVAVWILSPSCGRCMMPTIMVHDRLSCLLCLGCRGEDNLPTPVPGPRPSKVMRAKLPTDNTTSPFPNRLVDHATLIISCRAPRLDPGSDAEESVYRSIRRIHAFQVLQLPRIA